jgi:hypothetical protein
MTTLKVGDRVHVYGTPGPHAGGWAGIVVLPSVHAVWGAGVQVKSTYNKETYTVHEKQLRRLKPKEKKKPVEFTCIWKRQELKDAHGIPHDVIFPDAFAYFSTLMPFVGKRTKVTVEVIEG